MGYLIVSMQGTVSDVNTFNTKNGNKGTRGKFNITMANKATGEEYTKVMPFSSWGDIAEVLAEIPENVEVKATGSLRTASFDKKCPNCNGEYKAYWTEVVIEDVDV